MGLAYTVDSPVKVARFGISSVISIVENRLIEMMRKHYYPTIGETYQPISVHEEDFRAKRITLAGHGSHDDIDPGFFKPGVVNHR